MIEPDRVVEGLVEDKRWQRPHYVDMCRKTGKVELVPFPQFITDESKEGIKLKTIKEVEEEYKELQRIRAENFNFRLINNRLLTDYKNLVTALENLLQYSEEMGSWHKSEFLGEKGARGFYELGSSESYNDIVSKVGQILQNVVGVDGEDS